MDIFLFFFGSWMCRGYLDLIKWCGDVKSLGESDDMIWIYDIWICFNDVCRYCRSLFQSAGWFVVSNSVEFQPICRLITNDAHIFHVWDQQSAGQQSNFPKIADLLKKDPYHLGQVGDNYPYWEKYMGNCIKSFWITSGANQYHFWSKESIYGHCWYSIL